MQWIESRTPIARKPHECTGCFGTIEPGERYYIHKHVDADGFNTTKLHAACDRLVAESDEYEFEPGSFPVPDSDTAAGEVEGAGETGPCEHKYEEFTVTGAEFTVIVCAKCGKRVAVGEGVGEG